MSRTSVSYLVLLTGVWIIMSALAVTIIAQADSGSASEAGSGGGDQGAVDKIEDKTKKAGHKIEQGFNKAADKLEKKHVGEKIEQKLDKAVRKTEEGFEKAGKKIQQKLGLEKDPAETREGKEIQQKPGN